MLYSHYAFLMLQCTIDSNFVRQRKSGERSLNLKVGSAADQHCGGLSLARPDDMLQSIKMKAS